MKSLPNLQTEELLKNHSPNKECFVNEICLLTKYLEIKNYGVADLTILLLRYYYVLWCRRRKTKLKVTRLPDYQAAWQSLFFFFFTFPCSLTKLCKLCCLWCRNFRANKSPNSFLCVPTVPYEEILRDAPANFALLYWIYFLFNPSTLMFLC